MSTGYITYAKKLVLETEMIKNQNDLNRYMTELCLLEDTAVLLRPFQGKQITKRISTALDKHDPNMVYRLENTAGMTYIHLYKSLGDGKGREDVARFFMAYHSEGDIYNEAKFLDHNSLETRKATIEKHKGCFKVLPDFVKRYNAIVDTANALVEDATKVGLEYDFDIICRGSKN
jgi:hypothetical protein